MFIFLSYILKKNVGFDLVRQYRLNLKQLFPVGENQLINSLPNDKTLDLTRFKAFADDKIILTQKLKLMMGRVENIVGKGENAGYHHLLLFPQRFQSFLLQRC